MKMIEIQSTVNRQGQLTIPAHILQDIGLMPGDTVKLAYITSVPNSISNTLKEFVITSHGIAALEEDEESELILPNDILEAAGIPTDGDLEVICAKGAVVIMEAELLDSLPDELRQLFDDLGINPETVREVMRSGGVYDD